MLKKRGPGILFFCFITVHAFAQYAWEVRSPFPGDPRSACSAFSFETAGYVGLGYDGVEFRRSMYLYDVPSDTWIQKASLGGESGSGLERNVAASFTIGNKGYIGTGQGGAAFLNDFWQYDTGTDTWTQKADFAGGSRRSCIGFALEDKGYIGMGQDAIGFKNDLWQYDTLANTWSSKHVFPGTARRLPFVFVIDDKAYAGTGDDGTFTKDFYEYDPVSDNWFIRAEFGGSARYGATAFSIKDKGYVLFGYDTTLTNTNDFWEYDPLGDAWTQLPDFPGSRRSNAISFTTDSSAYVGMGYDSSFANDIWRWGDTSIVIIDTTVIAINDIQRDDQLLIYPNPVRKETSVLLPALIDIKNIAVYNAAGFDVTSNIVLNKVSQADSKTLLHLVMNDLPAGAYYLSVRDNDHHTAQKFIVAE